MKFLLLFLFTYLFIFCMYQVFIVKVAKKAKKSSKKRDKDPFELFYLEHRYSLDLKKISYDRILNIISLVSSFDIALMVTIVSYIDNTLIQILAGLVMAVVLILVSYHIVYLFYKKKGMIRNE